MSKLRWNPLLGTYTMVASNRQNRPNLPKEGCPFCLGSGKVPDHYEVFAYQNDFPALSQDPSNLGLEDNSIYKTERAYGKCEVILYSPDHEARLYDLSDKHVLKLVELWEERTKAFTADEKIKYVFAFENKGPEVGVTMPHPHGQIYGYPFIPLKVKTELDNCRDYYNETGKNMFDEMIALECAFGERIIFETDHFLIFLPFFTDYPYGVFIVSKIKATHFSDFSIKQKRELAIILKKTVGMFDTLFETAFPFMMCIHQGPVNSLEYGETEKYYRFHIEFYPPLRNANTIKYYASSEMGAWAAANTRKVEETAIELREALNRFEDVG